MVDGIVAGLTAGAARLRAAVTQLAVDALGSFRDALGIHSPSSVFAGLGLAIPQGVAEGVEDGAPEATGAVGDMMSTTTNNVASVAGGPSRAVTVGELHIHVGGDGEGAEDTARRVTDALRDFFETGLATEPA
jgi:phage-related minor tail protein